MKIIAPQYEILDRTGLSCTQKIEQAGRIAYRSEPKIKEGSDIEFCNMIIKKEHLSVLEFCNLHFLVQSPIGSSLYRHMYDAFERRVRQEKFLIITDYVEVDERTGCPCQENIIISGSVRAFYEAFRTWDDNLFYCGIAQIFRQFCLENQMQLAFYGLREPGDALDDVLKYMRRLEARDVINTLGRDVAEKHCRLGIKFTCSRAVSHELVRHRRISFLMESQRYVRYTDGTESETNEIAFIKPCFWEDGSYEMFVWERGIEQAERTYFELLGTSSPQAARSVLPNSTATRIMLYGTIKQWRHLLYLRTGAGADPSMKEIMIPLSKDVEFNNIKYWE